MALITLNYAPMPHQVELHIDPNRFKIIVGGRRAGKTKSAFQEMLRYALSHPDSLCWWVAPTYNEAREVGFAEFEAYREQLQPVIVRENQSIMRVAFKNGSTIYWKGADRRDSLRGRGINFLCVDEAAFLEEDTWRKVLRPALADKQGKAILTTTPNGRNWFHYLYQQSSRNDRQTYKTYHWTSFNNLLLTHEELQDLKEDLSPIDYRQEILAEFVTKAGQVYDDFGEENIVYDFKPDPQIHDIYIGADFGFANPAAFVFMAVNRNSNTVTQFAEIVKSHTKIQEHTDNIMQILNDFNLRPRDVKSILSDPAGNADEITSGESPVDYLRKFFPVINMGSKIAPGVALVRSFVYNTVGERRFFVDRRCNKTIDSMYGYTYSALNKMTSLYSEEPLKDGINDHACDAVRYFFVNVFPQNRYFGNAPKTQDYFTNTIEKTIIKKCSKCYNPFASKTPKDQPPYFCPRCSEDD
jgi:PBSX family phage terminase large subunit